RFVISGHLQGVNYGNWVRRHARDLGLNGYVKFSENRTVSIVVAGEELEVNKFRDIINTSASKKATIFKVEEKKRISPVKLGFEIVNVSLDQELEDGYFPVRLVGISKLSQQKVNKGGKKTNRKRIEKKDYEEKYKELVMSKSWKVTKPLRTIAKLFKR